MGEILSTSETRRAIFDGTFSTLSDIDMEYRRDSELSMAQRDFHKERIAASEAELERLEETARIRDIELTTRRKKIAEAALKLYATRPEVSEDHSLVFALAGQLRYGRTLETHELTSMTNGLLALDTAVDEHRPILRTINGNFDSLMIPETGAKGLVPEIADQRQHRQQEESVNLVLPIEKWFVFFDNSQFPSARGGNGLEVLDDFISYDEDELKHRDHPTPATVASSYHVQYEIPGQRKKDDNSRQISYVIGEELIQELIAHSGDKKKMFGPNTELAYKSWLAAKVAGYDIECRLEDLAGPIIGNMAKIIEKSSKAWGDRGVVSIDSEIAGILLEAVRELGAEEKLYEKFSAQMVGHYGSGSIYKDPTIARTIFDAVLEIPNK